MQHSSQVGAVGNQLMSWTLLRLLGDDQLPIVLADQYLVCSPFVDQLVFYFLEMPAVLYIVVPDRLTENLNSSLCERLVVCEPSSCVPL